MHKIGMAVLLAAIVSPPAMATMVGHEIQSGESLLKMCNGAERVKMLGMMCHSYLNGYIDTATVYDSGGKFCLGVGDKQRLPTVVVTWLNAHPDHFKKPAPLALGKLLSENYPCRK